ncbi:MAG: sensor histidine kinase [Lachnospiraceae bacterium]|nr:sensor histidine kinase [Lachnospiraceae bacterium]
MKKIINYKNLSIGKKFTVTFCLWLLVPLLLMFLWINKSVTDQIVEENCKTRLEILKQTEYGITNMIENVTSVTLDIIGDGEIQNYLKISDTEDEEADNLKNDIAYNLGKITSLKTYLSRISIFTEEKIVFQTGKYMVEEKAIEISDVAQQEGRIVWDAAKKDENYLLSRDRDNYEVSAYRAIVSYYDFENVLAYERITIDEDYICSIYSGIATDTTEQFFIINKQGEIISSLNKELLGKPYEEEAVLKKVIRNKEGYYIDQEKQLVVSYYCLPKVQWYVVKIDRQEEIIGQGLLKTITLVCMFLSMAFALAFHNVQKKRIVMPIVHLAKDVSNFHEGEYKIGVYSNAQDEIGELNNNFIEMANYIQELIEHVYKSRLKEKEAQLQYLQSQINPHFLYNTLDSMRWMAVKAKQYELAEQIEALANLFRHALNQGKHLTTVEKEIAHLKDYLTIQKCRFGERIKTTIEADAQVLKCTVLNLILQPLVENAIVHGLETKIEGGNIHIRVKKEGENLLYIVEDDGVGTEQENIRRCLMERTNSNNALALDNINQRIKHQYGEKYGLLFYSKIGAGTKVEVRMPLECEE